MSIVFNPPSFVLWSPMWSIARNLAGRGLWESDHPLFGPEWKISRWNLLANRKGPAREWSRLVGRFTLFRQKYLFNSRKVVLIYVSPFSCSREKVKRECFSRSDFVRPMLRSWVKLLSASTSILLCKNEDLFMSMSEPCNTSVSAGSQTGPMLCCYVKYCCLSLLLSLGSILVR